jgi:hypothetical protein
MTEIVAILTPWAMAFVGFVLLNWFAIHQMKKRFNARMEDQDGRVKRARKAIAAIRASRDSSRSDRIDGL